MAIIWEVTNFGPKIGKMPLEKLFRIIKQPFDVKMETDKKALNNCLARYSWEVRRNAAFEGLKRM